MRHTGRLLADSVARALSQGESQYYMKPHILINHGGKPIGPIRDGDSVIFCCRRGEREIQLTRAFADPSFQEFPTARFNQLTFVTMTRYHEMFAGTPVAFPPSSIPGHTLGEVISRHGLRQLRVAESEKFAHVTTFFNGGRNKPFPGEDHLLVPSLKNVSFDKAPEMRSSQVAEGVLEGMASQKYHFILVNFANGDVVGHLDNFDAKIRCAEALDARLALILKAASREGYMVLITADHGLLERGYGPDGMLNMHHTQNPVPCILLDDTAKVIDALEERGILADVAPTVLQLMHLPKPEEMNGKSLLRNTWNSDETGRKLVIIIMDGWGIGSEDESNPIFIANTPTWDDLVRDSSYARLRASGEAVGLLKHKPGNSEAGHMNIGAGRIILQDDVRIAEAIKDGSFQTNSAFLEAIEGARERNGALHLITMLSNRSSHGSLEYPIALLRLAKKHGLDRVYLHPIFNRPFRAETAPNLLRKLESEMESIGIGEFASGIGRGFALDRDGDYQKTKIAYDALVFGKGMQVQR